MTNASIVWVRTLLTTLLLNARRLRRPLQKVCKWFIEANCYQISPTTKELLFSVIPISEETKVINKLTYTTLPSSNKLRLLFPLGEQILVGHEESK